MEAPRQVFQTNVLSYHFCSGSRLLTLVVMVSGVDRAKRALVTLLRQLAAVYAVSLAVTRDSADSAVRTAFRKLSRKTHPDHGGRGEREGAPKSSDKLFKPAR